DRRNYPPAKVDLEGHVLMRSSEVQVPPVLGVAGPPEAPPAAYRSQRAAPYRLNRAIGDRLGSPRVVAADDEVRVITGDPAVVVEHAHIVHQPTTASRPSANRKVRRVRGRRRALGL